MSRTLKKVLSRVGFESVIKRLQDRHLSAHSHKAIDNKCGRNRSIRAKIRFGKTQIWLIGSYNDE